MQKGRDVVLVTGATGQQGGAVARQLLSRGHRVRALTRKPQGEAAKALAVAGAEVVPGDLNDVASLEKALGGAWGVFSVQNAWEAGVEEEERQGKRLAEVARKASISHFVYTSVGSAHRRTGIPHFENKARIEETVRGLGFPSYTILRPVFFMENWTSPSFKPSLMEGKLAIGIRPDTPLEMIAVDDIGAYGLKAFEQHAELNRREIDIAGDEHTMLEAARILGNAMGRKVEFVQVPIEELRKFSADMATMLEWFDRVGYDVHIRSRSREFGIPPTSLAAWGAKAAWR